MARGAATIVVKGTPTGCAFRLLSVARRVLTSNDAPMRAPLLADELGMRPLLAHCHLGLGKLYRLTGDYARALEHLTTATTMYRKMDMRFWLEQAEAEMRALA